MRDELLDIVAATHKLGFFEWVKVVTDDKTRIEAMSTDEMCLVIGEFHKPVEGLFGTFAIGEMKKFVTIINIPEYNEGAKITVTTREDGEPDGFKFVNATGDFKNTYRFMPPAAFQDKVREVETYDDLPDPSLICKPKKASIQRFQYQVSATPTEYFTAKTKDGALIFSLGGHAITSGDFTFETACEGALLAELNWPVQYILSILNLNGDITMKFWDSGGCIIEVDTGLAKYQYFVSAEA